MSILDVAIVGAGPYGLSIAAHLSPSGANYGVFGKPMETWRSHMPKGMSLKSDGFASSLSAPTKNHRNEHSLRAYCARHAIPYDDFSIPVALATFVDYALDFQRRYVPELDKRSVAEIHARDRGFELLLDDGEAVEAHKVILAVGICHFDYVPNVLSALPSDIVSHSSAHHDIDHFKDREVTVIGAGASAIDLAALLHEAGANVRLVVRKSTIRFGSTPHPNGRSAWQKIRHPQSGLGPSLRSRLACDLPHLFRFLPSPLRLEIVRRHLGPAAAWHLAPRVVDKVSMILGHEITNAEIRDRLVQLTLRTADGSTVTTQTEYVIAATGYRADIDRLSFIDKHLRSRITRVRGMPILSSNFECSVPGLYFVGNAAAGSFGPLMRFAYGCDFAARRVSRHVVGG
jgi:cation diffusion facilitator CzcD-associated flavoprotein CzcO